MYGVGNLLNSGLVSGGETLFWQSSMLNVEASVPVLMPTGSSVSRWRTAFLSQLMKFGGDHVSFHPVKISHVISLCNHKTDLLP